MKVKEKEDLLLTMIEDGKKELLKKRLKAIDETVIDNPYDRLVQKVVLRQRQDLKRI